MTRASDRLTETEQAALDAEMSSAFKLFGAQSKLTGPEWFSVLMEEVGEVARELNEATLRGQPENELLRAELLQVAAVAMRWRAVL